jgi:excisionase family DNA binding protein
MLSFVWMIFASSLGGPLVSENPDELLTVAEVAAELKVTEATVRRWINQDKLAARRLGGGEFRVLRRDLDAFQGIAPEPPRQQRSKRPFTSTAARMNVQ